MGGVNTFFDVRSLILGPFPGRGEGQGPGVEGLESRVKGLGFKFNYIISSLPKNWGQWKSGVGVPMGFQLMKCGTGSLSPHL